MVRTGNFIELTPSLSLLKWNLDCSTSMPAALTTDLCTRKTQTSIYINLKLLR